MEILEIVLLVLLLISAAFIVVAVVLQKSNEDGLFHRGGGLQEGKGAPLKRAHFN